MTRREYAHGVANVFIPRRAQDEEDDLY
jgi:hypothetical protein